MMVGKHGTGSYNVKREEVVSIRYCYDCPQPGHHIQVRPTRCDYVRRPGSPTSYLSQLQAQPYTGASGYAVNSLK